MNGTKCRAWSAIAAIALLATPAQRIAAQWSTSAYGVAEYDTKETLLLLAGLSASPGGRGIAPTLGLQAYHLSYEAGKSRVNDFTVKPAIGLRNGFEGGSVSASVGYAFSSRNNSTTAVGSPVVAERGEGVVLSGGLELTPSPSPLGYQLLSSYNFGSESFWGRGRVTTRVGDSGPNTMRVGGEVAYLSGTGYSAWQPGVVLLWQRASGMSFGIGGGAKLIDSGGNAAYFKVEGGFPLFR